MKPQITKDRTKRARRIETKRQHKVHTPKHDRKPPLRSIDCQYMSIEDVLMEQGYYD